MKELTKQQVLDLATDQNPVIAVAGNKIEFANGDVYAKNFSTGLYRKAKVTTL